MYDIVFISYQEPNADEVYEDLKARFPMAKRCTWRKRYTSSSYSRG